MVTISKATHIEPASDGLGFVQEMFEPHAPCRTMAGYLPIKAQGTFLPLVQGLWAANGETLVAGAVIEPPARSPPGALRILKFAFFAIQASSQFGAGLNIREDCSDESGQFCKTRTALWIDFRSNRQRIRSNQ